MKRSTLFFVAGLALTLALAVVVSQLASGEPDGLEFVAAQEGFDDRAEEHPLSGSPLADYGGDDRGTVALAGLVGVAVTLAVGFAVFRLAGAGRRRPAPDR